MGCGGTKDESCDRLSAVQQVHEGRVIVVVGIAKTESQPIPLDTHDSRGQPRPADLAIAIHKEPHVNKCVLRKDLAARFNKHAIETQVARNAVEQQHGARRGRQGS